MKKPFFSIIVPCCDTEPYLAKCMESIVSQDFEDWELIAVSEKSRDGTEAALEKAAASDSRIRLASTGTRSGSVSVPRNIGIDMARGEYALFVDSDDWIAPGSLGRIAAAIGRRPGADLYPCKIDVVDCRCGKSEDGPVVETRDNFPADFHGELSGVDATLMLEKRFRDSFYCPMLQMTVHRIGFLKANNLKCIPSIAYQDSDFTPRAIYLARRIAPLHEPFYIYRLRDWSITTSPRSRPGAFLPDIAIRLNSLFKFFDEASRLDGFNPEVAKLVNARLLKTILRRWFSPHAIRTVPQDERAKTVSAILLDGGCGAMERVFAFGPRGAQTVLRLLRKFVAFEASRNCVETSLKTRWLISEYRNRIANRIKRLRSR